MPKVSDIYKRPPISDRDWTLPFGKFKGKSLAWLMDAEPDYLAWCIEREMIELDVSLQDEFEQMNPWLIPDAPSYVETHGSPMTKTQFKKRWESDEDGGGICFDDIADCAKEWNLFSVPRTAQIDRVRYAVLKAAKTTDCEEYNPTNLEE